VVAIRSADLARPVSITLEPGGQLELSGAPVGTVHEVCGEIDRHLADLAPASARCGFQWLSLGYHPWAMPEQLPWVPKRRYVVMREYFPQVGGRGLDMMRRTATVQVNLDYASEEDAMRKLRVGLMLSPVVTAIFANSPLAEGKLSGVLSERARVWLDTDPARTGLLPALQRPGARFADYVEWALDVPMYLFFRGGETVTNTGQTFRSFWHEGFQGHRATEEDWRLHLNTLFPEVRLQNTLELRGADAVPRRYFCAIAALWCGIMYDDRALADAERLVADWSSEQLERLRPAVAERALAADFCGQPLRAIAERVLEIGRAGLSRRGRVDHRGRDEGWYLEPVVELVAEGRCPADVLLAGLSDRGSDLRRQVVEHAALAAR